MRSHDRLDAGPDSLGERIELHLFQSGDIGVDRRHEIVRVQGRVAVPRKMLGRGDHAVSLAAPDKGGGQAANALRPLSERARADDGVVGVDVDVHDRRVGHMDSQSSSFDSRDFSHLVGQVFGIRRPERHERREKGGPVDPHGGAPFEVGGYEQRDPGFFLEEIGEVSGLIHFSGEDDQAADIFFDDEVDELLDCIAVAVEETAVVPPADHLADLLL